MLRAQAGIGAVNWDTTDWEPPKAQVSSFRVPGRIAKNLSPLEAGVLLDLPLAELLGLMVGNIERKGMLRIKSFSPLTVERRAGINASNDPYESTVLASVKPDGTIDEAGAWDPT